MYNVDDRIARINELLADADKIIKIRPNNFTSDDQIAPIPFISWLADVSQFLMDHFDNNNAYVLMFQDSVISDVDRYHPNQYHLVLGCEILKKLKGYLIKNPGYSKRPQIDSIYHIEMVCNRFHIVAKKLRSRRENRPTISIDDEYDVQDLLHGLLKVFFNDIRPEEWTPSYAGGSSRMDFLLKKEKIVIEVKKTRQNLNENEIGKQLLIDIAKYEGHPDCKTLVCFVYDPEERIINHAGLETDLMSKSTENLQIKAYVRPTGN